MDSLSFSHKKSNKIRATYSSYSCSRAARDTNHPPCAQKEKKRKVAIYFSGVRTARSSAPVQSSFPAYLIRFQDFDFSVQSIGYKVFGSIAGGIFKDAGRNSTGDRIRSYAFWKRNTPCFARVCMRISGRVRLSSFLAAENIMMASERSCERSFVRSYGRDSRWKPAIRRECLLPP